MKPEQWQEIEWLYHAAMERTEDQRIAFLESVCSGDGNLRREVQSLVTYGQSSGQFIDRPALEVAAELLTVGETAEDVSRIDPDRWIGQRISQYRVVRKLASGGMGDVCGAVRADDEYQKQVALKLVSAGQHSSFFISRFRNERQILATLDHPNITRLLDGGTTNDGTPYFVMELIDGLSIDEYCNRNRLSIRERLRLFLQVCSAVQYAHQRLIIHRDIKPGNILVTADGVPKLMDFGIAKILNQDGDDGQTATITALRAFTPGYASPEQIKGEPITTASDIYSLGVVLYELLTGRCPYRLVSRSPHEMARAVCESEPEKPSTVVTRDEPAEAGGTKSTAAELSAARDASPEKLKKRLRGDLDNIVLMALRKEPQRRYASAEQFKEDIRRHLESLPVIARNDTVGDRRSKFIRRNKAGVAAALAVVLILVTGMAVTAREARIAQAERARAERRFNDVRKLANSLMFDVHDSIKDLPGATPARRILVTEALKYIDGLAQESSGDVSLQRELATAYEKLGDVQGNPRYSNLGDTAGALQSYRKALAIRESVLQKDPSDPLRKWELFGTDNLLGWALQEQGDPNGALASLRQAASLAESVAAQSHDPSECDRRAGAYWGIGTVLEAIGSLPGALENYRRASAIRGSAQGATPQQSATLRTHLVADDTGVARILARQGEFDAALAIQHEATSLLVELSKNDPNNSTLQGFLGDSYYFTGSYLEKKRDLDEALDSDRKAQSIFQNLSHRDPSNAWIRRWLGISKNNIGRVLLAEGHSASALQTYRQALAILLSLRASAPTNTVTISGLANVYAGMGHAYTAFAASERNSSVRTEDWRNARVNYHKSLDLWNVIRSQGSLDADDKTKPDELEAEVAKCDNALARLHNSN